MKKPKIGNYFRFNALLLIAASVITIASLITGGYITEGYALKINDVSDKRIKAPKQVENTVATEKLRQHAYESVTTRYKVDAETNEKIIEGLSEFFQESDLLRKKSSEIFIPERSNGETGDTLPEEVPSAEAAPDEEMPQANTAGLDTKKPADTKEPPVYENSFLLEYLTVSQIEFLINMADDQYKPFKENATKLVNEALEAGIKEEALTKALVDLKAEFSKTYTEADISELGYDIASSFIAPNLSEDLEATEKLRQEKMKEIEPVYYRKGQTIIDDGEIVSEEAYAALDSLGLISKGYKENIVPIIGAVLLVICIFGFSCLYIFYYNEKLYKSPSEALLLFVIYTTIILLVRLSYSTIPHVFLPVIAFSMLVSMLLDSRLAIVLNIGVTILTVLIANGSLEIALYFIISGTFMAILARHANQRNIIYFIGLIISFASVMVFLSIGLLTERKLDSTIIINTSYAFLNGFMTVIVCMGSLPFWETMFGVVTPIKLLDLTNPNNELLRRLTIEAPGTYHHSLIVANLAETAAYDIKADTNIARVGGYYHDIGKLKYPQYFSENQLGENPHDDLDPYSSVQIITSHVSIGLEMADERKLPKAIKDIIEEHHGNTLVKYFYHKAKKEDADEEINEADFRYKHRRPQTRESAIIMLADTVEAAVRSMISKSKKMEEVEEMVRNLIKDKIDDNQLIDSQLTMKDIDTVSNSFMRVFKGMYHERIPYPKMETPKKAVPKEEVS
jgi:hypothetical protein